MADSQQEEWLILRLPRRLIAPLQRRAAEEDVTVSAVVEAAVAKLCADLEAERTKKFQQAPARRGKSVSDASDKG